MENVLTQKAIGKTNKVPSPPREPTVVSALITTGTMRNCNKTMKKHLEEIEK